MTTQILVTISRTWNDFTTLRRVLGTVYAAHPQSVLIHGDAPRGDRAAAAVWRELGGSVEAWPADWGRHGRRAGMLRNARMVEANPVLAVAFIRNQSRGATHCADLAEGAGIVTVRYTQDDEPEQAVQLTMEGNTND